MQRVESDDGACKGRGRPVSARTCTIQVCEHRASIVSSSFVHTVLPGGSARRVFAAGISCILGRHGDWRIWWRRPFGSGQRAQCFPSILGTCDQCGCLWCLSVCPHLVSTAPSARMAIRRARHPWPDPRTGGRVYDSAMAINWWCGLRACGVQIARGRSSRALCLATAALRPIEGRVCHSHHAPRP
jgi:hypothetical protein